MKTKIAVLLVSILLGSCRSNESDCVKEVNGKGILIAYKIAKHSHIWIKTVESGTIHDIGSLGGRRIPTINLGDTVDIVYCIKNEGATVNLRKKFMLVRKTTKSSQFNSLPQYKYLR